MRAVAGETEDLSRRFSCERKMMTWRTDNSISVELNDEEQALFTAAADRINLTIDEYFETVIRRAVEDEKRDAHNDDFRRCYICRESILSFLTVELTVFEAKQHVCSACLISLIKESIESGKSVQETLTQVTALLTGLSRILQKLTLQMLEAEFQSETLEATIRRVARIVEAPHGDIEAVRGALKVQ